MMWCFVDFLNNVVISKSLFFLFCLYGFRNMVSSWSWYTGFEFECRLNGFYTFKNYCTCSFEPHELVCCLLCFSSLRFLLVRDNDDLSLGLVRRNGNSNCLADHPDISPPIF